MNLLLLYYILFTFLCFCIRIFILFLITNSAMRWTPKFSSSTVTMALIHTATKSKLKRRFWAATVALVVRIRRYHYYWWWNTTQLWQWITWRLLHHWRWQFFNLLCCLLVFISFIFFVSCESRHNGVFASCTGVIHS